MFGLIGSATTEMFDALYDAKDIQFIGVHDERTGMHMADGFARHAAKALLPELYEKFYDRVELWHYLMDYEQFFD